MNQNVIAGACYELGERVREYKDAQNFASVISENRIPDMPELMGFGHYHETSEDVFSLAIKSARKSLAAAGVAGKDIDVVLFCSTDFAVIEGDGRRYVHQLCKELELTSAYPIGITLGNCTAFLSAIKTADAMLRGSDHANILVVTADKVYDESQRCVPYGIFSDAAASCVLSRTLKTGFPVLATHFRSDYTLIEDSQGLNDTELYEQVQRKLLAAASQKVSGIKKTFGSNIFVPITRAKEARIGFTEEQLYLENVAGKGHCFSADAVINLCDYMATRDDERNDDSAYMLTADADGLRVSVLISGAAVA